MKLLLRLRPQRLATRLTVLITVASLLVTALSLGSFIILEDRSHHELLADEIDSLSAMLGENCRAALVFDDRATATTILHSIRSIKAVRSATLITPDDHIFASYSSEAAAAPPDFPPTGTPVELLTARTRSHSWRLAQKAFIYRPIFLNEEPVGGLILQFSHAQLHQRWLAMLTLGTAILLIALLCSWLIARRATRLIAAPIEQLSRAMGEVGGRGNLQVQLPSRRQDELGLLTDGFNDMVVNLAARDRLLEELNTSLEVRIRERTSELQQSESRYRSLFESSPISLWEEDLSGAIAVIERLRTEGVRDFSAFFREHPAVMRECVSAVRIIDVNQKTLSLYDASSRNALFEQLEQVYTTSANERFVAELVAMAGGARSCYFEQTNRTLAGNAIDVAVLMSIVPGHEDDCSRVIVAVEDITARRLMELQLRTALQDQELLVQEVHHRVKNNLQIISSLINLQLKKVSDPTASAQLQSTLLRIRSMALIHDKLFHPPSEDSCFDAFIRELASEIAALFAANLRNITIRIEIEPIPINFEQRMVFAMIINELLSNALKYAFPDERAGTIQLCLGIEAQTIVALRVRDDGVGLPPGFAAARSVTLGYRLIESLIRQLNGTLEFDIENGTTVTIRTLLE